VINSKSIKPLFLAAGGALAAAAVAITYLTAPGKADKRMRAPFSGRNFAHRGLHTPDKSVPENSLPAFKAAAELGYGVELDVHITKDGKIVVFHDDDLSRLCGVGGRIKDMTWEKLRKLRVLGTEYPIPLLSEVLSVINGRGPIIVELKRGGRNRELCEKTYRMMKKYAGAFCVESFDPRIVRWFRRHAPEVLRGQLAYHPGYMTKDAGKIKGFLVGNLLTNFLARPHFIAYGIGRKTLTVKLCELLGAMKFAWTSRDLTSEADNDAVIFEHYLPAVRYRQAR